MICTLEIMIDKLIETKETAFINFIDYIKTFDNVSYNQLFNIRIQMGLSTHLAYLIQNFYVKQEARIWWNIEPFSNGTGVRQGCIFPKSLQYIYRDGDA